MIDEIDFKILKNIQNNAKLTNADLAPELGIASSGELERVKRLEKKGIIKGYITQLQPEALDLRLLAFLFVRSNEKPGKIGPAEQVAQLSEVLEVHYGEDCYLLKVRARDKQSLATEVREQVGALDEVVSTKPLLCLKLLRKTICFLYHNLNKI